MLNENACRKLISTRYILAWLSFLGFCVVYMLRVNLSVALIAMVKDNSAKTNINAECPTNHMTNSSAKSSGDSHSPQFNWDRSTQGYVLGSFFYGYIVTQIPGGWLAGKYGGKKLFGFGVLGTALLTLVTPPAAKWSVYALIVTRVLEGIGEGVTFPAMHAMWAEWAPPLERSRLVTLSYAGAQFGTVVGLPLSGWITDSLGWEWVFYIFGILGCVWFVLWMIFVADNPTKHKRIRREEKEYILTEIRKTKNQEPVTFMNTPWLEMAKSPAVWAVSIAHFSHNWGFYTLLTCLPTFMKDVLHFDLSQDAFLSCLPYIFMWLAVWFGGFLVDYIRERQILSTASSRKLFLGFGLLVPAVCLIGTSFVGCDYTLAVVLLCIAGAFDGISQSGYNVNHLDIAPKYAGTLMGITNSIATIPGFLGPQVAGWMTAEQSTSVEWRGVFIVSAEVYLFGVIIFSVLGKGELQPWAVSNNIEYLVVDDAGDQNATLLGGNSDTDSTSNNLT